MYDLLELDKKNDRVMFISRCWSQTGVLSEIQLKVNKSSKTKSPYLKTHDNNTKFGTQQDKTHIYRKNITGTILKTLCTWNSTQ